MNTQTISRNQWLAIAILLFTVLTGGSAQLTDLIGADATKSVIALSTLVTGFLAGFQIIVGGNQTQAREVLQNPANQQQIVRSVLDMPGVEAVEVNKRASTELAQLAVDTSLAKIVAKPSDAAQVNATASANQ